MTEDEMYEALIRNDADFDGVFFYAVKSTGIFCRPSCPSKKPLRNNICFFPSAEAAEKAGFRPCKRCRSDLPFYRPVRDMATQIKDLADRLYAEGADWTEIAEKAGLSEHYTAELFKSTFGMTPKAYMDGLRLRDAEQRLTETDDRIADISLAVGFGSISAFNRFFKSRTGLTPTAYRNEARKPESRS